MEQIIPVYLTVFGIILIIAFLAMRSDESISRRLERVRVRVDENRHSRQMPDPPEEDVEIRSFLEWMVFGSVVLLIVLLGLNS